MHHLRDQDFLNEHRHGPPLPRLTAAAAASQFPKDRAPVARDLWQVRRRCDRAAQILSRPDLDEVLVMRAARVLKRATSDLKLGTSRRSAELGTPSPLVRAEALLEEIEGNLRAVLLQGVGEGRREMRRHAERALDQAFDVIDLLEGLL